MIKVSAGLSRKIGGANYSSKGGSVHPWANPFMQVPVTGKFKGSRIQQEKITMVPAEGFLPEGLAKGCGYSHGVTCFPQVLTVSRIDQSGLLFCQRGTIAMKLTAVFMQVPEGYIGFVEEIPGANSQGKTLGEARANLTEAVHLVLEANRDLSARYLVGQEVAREPFELAAL